MIELIRGDSGVAAALSLLFMGFIFLIFMGVYALGNNVQKRILLQSAVDNAAYAGALAQADTLSKLAVVNRAIAWQYIMNNRRHVDYIVQRYGYDILRAFWHDANEAAIKQAEWSPTACGNHKSGDKDYFAATTPQMTEQIEFDRIVKQIPNLPLQPNRGSKSNENVIKYQNLISNLAQTGGWWALNQYDTFTHIFLLGMMTRLNVDVTVAQGSYYDCLEGFFMYAFGHEDKQYGVCKTLSSSTIDEAYRNAWIMSAMNGEVLNLPPPDLDGNLMTAEPTWQHDDGQWIVAPDTRNPSSLILQTNRITAIPGLDATDQVDDQPNRKNMSWIRHGRVANSVRDDYNIADLYIKMYDQEQRKSYKTLEQEIIRGSMALAALNQVATELATGMERSIQDAVDTIAKEYTNKGMRFHTLIGGEAYKIGNSYQESNAGKMAANCMYFPNEGRFFKEPTEGGFDIRHTYKDGHDGENYESGNWSNGNYWWEKQVDTVNGGFRRQLGNFRPTSGFWTSYAYTWHCPAQHFQVNKTAKSIGAWNAICPPDKVSIRNGNSVMPGYYPNFIDKAKQPAYHFESFDEFFTNKYGMNPDVMGAGFYMLGVVAQMNFLVCLSDTLNEYYAKYSEILSQHGISNYSYSTYLLYAALQNINGAFVYLTTKRGEFNTFATSTMPALNQQAWEADHIKEYTNEDMTPWDNWVIPAGNLPDLCNYNHSATARPRMVNHRLFSKLGSIVVGACYATSNPVGTSRMLSKAFTPSNSSSLCAIAAARAGIRWPVQGEPDGAYRSCWSTQRETKWNLFADDWDAVMLPIARAWLICQDDDSNALNTIWRQPIASTDYYTEYSTTSLINAVMAGLGIHKNLTGLDTDVMH